MTRRELMAAFSFVPHPAQEVILRSKARFRFVRAGRRFGKTRLAAASATCDLIAGKRAWWVAPQYSMALEGFRYVIRNLESLQSVYSWKFRTRRNPQLAIEIPSTGGSLEFKSTTKTATTMSMVGAGLDSLYGDEIARIRGFFRMWEYDLRPTLMDTMGGALFFSTPYGKGDFYRLEKENLGFPDWEFFHFASQDNPHLPEVELQQMKARSSLDVIQQELQADYIDTVGSYFPMIPALEPVPPILREAWGYDYSPGTGIGNWAMVRAVEDSRHRVIANLEYTGNDPYEVQRAYLREVTAQGGLILADAHIPKTVKDDMVRHRVRFMEATTDRLGSLTLLRSYFNLELAGVLHEKRVPRLYEELHEAIIDMDNPGDLFGSDDTLDAFRYAFDYLTQYTNPHHGFETQRKYDYGLVPFQRGVS